MQGEYITLTAQKPIPADSWLSLIKPADFNAIIHHLLGLKPDDTIKDLAGCPTYLAPDGEVPVELL